MDHHHTTSRLLSLLELLQARAQLSGAELADRLDVQPRSVRRYIRRLQAVGIPIQSVPGPYGGYRLPASFRLPPLLFTDDEAAAVLLGLLVARRVGLGATAPPIASAMAKIERVLPAPLRQRVQAAEAGLTFTPPRFGVPAIRAGHLLTLGAAASTGQRVRVQYRHQGPPAADVPREIDPYGLVHHHGRWYAVGWCHLRDQVRLFRLDRMLEVELRPQRFAPRPDLDCAAYVVRSLATLPYRWSVAVWLDLPLAEARRRVPPDVAGLAADIDAGSVLRTRVDDLVWMARLLVGLGCRFSVLEPAELRTTLGVLAGELGALAETSQPCPGPPGVVGRGTPLALG